MPDPKVPAGSDFTAAPPNPDIASMAQRQGAYSWLSSQLFEILGSWVTSTPENEVGVYFGAAMSEWAWHAELWSERLPELREISRSSLVVAPDALVVEALQGLGALTVTLDRLDGLASLCAILDKVYAAHGAVVSSVRDAPTIRTLDLVRSDLAAAQTQIAALSEIFVTPGTHNRVVSAEVVAVRGALDQAFTLICEKSPTLRA